MQRGKTQWEKKNNLRRNLSNVAILIHGTVAGVKLGGNTADVLNVGSLNVGRMSQI